MGAYIRPSKRRPNQTQVVEGRTSIDSKRSGQKYGDEDKFIILPALSMLLIIVPLIIFVALGAKYFMRD